MEKPRKIISTVSILISTFFLFCLFSNGAIRGRILVNEKSYAGLEVKVWDNNMENEQSTETDAGGYYKITDLDNGEWHVTVIGLSPACQPETNEVVINGNTFCVSESEESSDLSIKCKISLSVCFKPTVSSNRCVAILEDAEAEIRYGYYDNGNICGYIFSILWDPDMDYSFLEEHDEIISVMEPLDPGNLVKESRDEEKY